jgi:processive 1,2-diacylglycerol beta-glucosyltransferase
MRVLIATVTAGGGHLAAAAALLEAWEKMRPQDVVQKVDLLDFASRLYRKLYINTYVKVVEHAPEIYGLVFNRTDQVENLSKINQLRRTLAHRTNKGFVRFLNDFKPDAILCSHYLPLEILAHLKEKKRGTNPFTVCIVTDFEVHSFWMEPSVDLYCVAADETRGSLVARGTRAGQIAVTGIPVAAKFSVPINPLDVRRQYGLRDDLPTVLVLSGGFGMGPVEEILAELDKAETNFQMLVVAGKNQELRNELAVKEYKHPARILGFARNMHELMAVSDLIVTKPGGLTSSEALAVGRPLLIVNPIPGQETANSDFLLERGAAVKVNRAEDLSFRIKQLLGSRKLNEMAAAAKRLGRPQAAEEVCRVTVEHFGKKDTPSKSTPKTPSRRVLKIH